MSFGGIPAPNHFLECAELFLFRADSPAFGGIIRQFNDHFDLLGPPQFMVRRFRPSHKLQEN